MNHTELYEMYSRLLHCGWDHWEVGRLFNFLLRYQHTRMDLPDLTFDMRKLEFLRYLVQTGRLSDEDMRTTAACSARASTSQTAAASVLFVQDATEREHFTWLS